MSYHDIEPQDHAGWTAPGEITATEDFNYAEVDRLLGEIEVLPEESQQQAADVLARLFTFVWSGQGNLRSALVRFTGLCMGLRADLVSKSYAEAAKEVGCTKQNFSKSILKAERVLGLKFRRTRSKLGRSHMAEARLANPVARNTRKAAA